MFNVCELHNKLWTQITHMLVKKPARLTKYNVEHTEKLFPSHNSTTIQYARYLPRPVNSDTATHDNEIFPSCKLSWLVGLSHRDPF